MAATKKTAGNATKATAAQAPAAKSAGNTASANRIAPAKGFEASGAPEQTGGSIDVGHPAVDADPRAETSADQNRIDFNDPGKSGAEAVAENLKAQK